jgi:hypothetical protein
MHCVSQIPAFVRAAKEAGMTEEEVDELVDYLAANPLAGDEMSGTGGCRKLRWRGRNKGKSGGYRTITFYSGEDIPLYLITVFSKGEKANLSKGERNELSKLTSALVEAYRNRVVELDRRNEQEGI